MSKLPPFLKLHIAALTSNKVAPPEFAQQALQDLEIVGVDSDLGLIAEQLQCEICKKGGGHGIISFSTGYHLKSTWVTF